MSRRGENCTGCCGDCGRHFTSQTAFDAHRIGKFSDNTRGCGDPSVIEALEVSTYDGRCPVRHMDDVVVWKVAGSSERFKELFSDPGESSPIAEITPEAA